MELSNKLRSAPDPDFGKVTPGPSGSGQPVPGSSSSGTTMGSRHTVEIEEDEVDKILRAEDGKIYRKRNDQL